MRGSADVEADVEFGDLYDTFLASDAVADDVQIAEVELGEFLDEERFFEHSAKLTMEEAARQFARKVLLLHLLALALVIVGVVFASREVYQQARQQSIDQAIQRQKLLAWQTARGVENYYQSILLNLDVIKSGDDQSRDDTAAAKARAMLPAAPLLWHQLEGRVSTLFWYMRTTSRVGGTFPRDEVTEAQEIANAHRQWLKGIESPSISGFTKLGNSWGHLICVPMPDMRGGFQGRPPSDGRDARDGPRPGPVLTGPDRKLVLVAVVPVSGAMERFLNVLNHDTSTSGLLLDETGVAMGATEKAEFGQNMLTPATDSRLRELISAATTSSKAGTKVIDESIESNGRTLSPRIVVVQPIKMAGRNWSVMLSSQLSEVDAVVSSIFRKALYASAFVVLAMTAILSSTSIQMIRGRLRLERIRNDLLARELTQARKIQLAWLPNADSVVSGVDVAAINEPASHVSGDFYDWFELPDGRTVVTIGDVTGHGMSAAFLMATTQLLIRNTMVRLGDPGACLEEVNRQLCTQIFNGQFVTALIVVLDTENGTMSVGTAGHFPPLLSDGERLQTVEMEAQLVLGVEKNERYQTERFDLPERFVLLLYTDGVIDAQGPGGERFRRQGVERALGEEFESAQEVVDTVVQAIQKFRGAHGLGDDLTLVAIQSQTAAVRSGVAA